MTEELTLRHLGSSDAPVVQQLIEADPEYFRRVTGEGPGPDEAHDPLIGRPATLASEQKAVLGVFRGTTLVAVIGLMRGWPDPVPAHIGLLQVHSVCKGPGVGRRAHDLLLDWIEEWPESIRLRAAIVQKNAEHAARSGKRWATGPSARPRPHEQGSVHTTVRLWTRPLTHR